MEEESRKIMRKRKLIYPIRNKILKKAHVQIK